MRRLPSQPLIANRFGLALLLGLAWCLQGCGFEDTPKAFGRWAWDSAENCAGEVALLDISRSEVGIILRQQSVRDFPLQSQILTRVDDRIFLELLYEADGRSHFDRYRFISDDVMELVHADIDGEPHPQREFMVGKRIYRCPRG
ncbi:MAG: hypothetical protein AAGF15_03710 [Pseudomonadota bacterium]